jgi:hypothetical protein
MECTNDLSALPFSMDDHADVKTCCGCGAEATLRPPIIQ